ncbi:MAG: Ig-like domain-containing protein [Lachnospiraceae bacterium]|nr:Ig-like domain-containing protein [Lachnospiraceae bacterium]
MNNIYERKIKRRKIPIYLVIIFIVMVGLIGIKLGQDSEAADNAIWLEYNNTQLANELTMDTSAVSLYLGSTGTQYADPKYKICWKIPIEADRKIIGFQEDSNYGNDYERQSQGLFNMVIKAKSAGTATLEVYVYDSTGLTGTTVSGSSMTVAQHVTLKINVQFAIDTQLDGNYQYVYEGDPERALILYTGEEEEMKLNVGDAGDSVLWQSANKDVVEMVTATNGAICAKAVGSGVTTISADGVSGHDSISVYVIPRISITGEEGTYNKSATYNISDGDWLYTDTIFEDNQTLTIYDKVVWVISKYDTNHKKVVIEDSLGNVKSDLIDLSTVMAATQQNLKVSAKAGQYFIDFYPAGTYKNENEKSSTVIPSTITINVYAELVSQEINLNTGDQFDFAEAINITQEEFLMWFHPTIPEMGNYLTYKEGIVSALASTEQESISIGIKVKEEYKEQVQTMLNPNNPKMEAVFTFRVVDQLLLNMQNVSIVVGQEMQLIASTATYEGTLEWTTSNPKYVSVSETGVIKGISKTKEDVAITVSLRLSNGSVKRAVCWVRVQETVNNISLNEKEIELLEGNSKTIVASFKPDRNEAPIQWMSSDEKVFSINVSSDKKSVVVTARQAGTAILTALNEENYVTAVCKVTVMSQITKISLPDSQMTVKLNREVIRLNASYTPKSITNNRLIWESSDNSVATVNESGLVTLIKAGTTIITVKPQYNTSPPIMAQCVLTVEQSSVGINLNESAITLEAGENKLLSYTLKPTNATTTVEWKSMDTGVATVTKDGLVTAKKAGTTYIIITCADGYSANCKVTVTQEATGIKLSVKKVTLGVGDVYAVGTTITPENCTNPKVTWSSQDTKIAKVSSDGKVTGVSVGKTIVFAKIKNGEVAYLDVTVTDSVKALSLDQTQKTLGVGKSFILIPIFNPTEATNKELSWTSSDPSIATVTADGKVTGIKGGTAMIICKADDGGHTAHCVVTVSELVSEVTLNYSSYQLKVNETVKLSATVNSSTATNKKLKWTTSNKKIATVNKNGKVTAKKVGKCTIKVTTTDGSNEGAACTIRVIKPVSSLKINHSYIKLIEGKTKKIKSKITPKSASIKGVKWTSADKNIAIVNSKGKITAISEGITTVTVSTTDGSKITAVCTVQVLKAVPVTSLTVSSQDITMVKGTSQSAAVSISPSNTTDKITYESDNKAVATVTSKGKIKAKKPGTATITVTSTSGKQVCMTVTVVGLNKTYLRLQQYDSDELWVEEITENVKWSSSNPAIARVNNGTVVARKVGTATITATVRGVKLQCKVKVVEIE